MACVVRGEMVVHSAEISSALGPADDSVRTGVIPRSKYPVTAGACARSGTDVMSLWNDRVCR